MSNTESAMAANHRVSSELAFAAEAAANVAMVDLGRVGTWSTVLSGAMRSPFCDATLSPTLASGERLDLTMQTTSLQAASDAWADRGADNPQWRLIVYQPFAAIARSAPTPGHRPRSSTPSSCVPGR